MSSTFRADAVRSFVIRLVGRRQVQGPAAALVACSAIVFLVVLAAIDYVTGAELSLSVFYLLPVVVAAIAVSTGLGLALAAAASLAWVLADALIDAADRTPALQIWNGVLRFLILSLVVLLVAALRRALEAAQASERRSREFLAFAAHQLRTPVAGLRVSAEALVLEGSTPTEERLLSNLTAQSARIGHLITALLQMARIDQGEPPDLRPADVFSLASSEIERHPSLVSRLDVRLHAMATVPPIVLLDGAATREALGNLLDNASRHAETAVDVTVGIVGGRIRIVVRDDGPGLPAGAEERAFDRFVSLDNQGGTGLGLAIARALARRQGGDLTYERREFSLDLPVVTPPGCEPPERRHGSQRHGAGTGAPA